jgi:hypothetical protein
MWFTRVSALMLVAALMLVPAVGRARQRVDLPHAKPRLTAPYRSVDVKPAPILVSPDTTRVVRVEPDNAPRYADPVDAPALPIAPDASDRGVLRGPPLL